MSEELQQKLRDQLWEVANRLRGNMSASDFMYFTLGFIFYKYLSEKIETYANSALEDDEVTFKELWEMTDSDAAELQEEVKNQCLENIGYFIEPKFLFSSVIEAIKRKENILPMLERSLKRIEDSTLGRDSEEDFGGLFSDIDLASPKLGKTADDKNTLVSNVLLALDDIKFGVEASQEIDILGDAYEYMISLLPVQARKPVSSILRKRSVAYWRRLLPLDIIVCVMFMILLVVVVHYCSVQQVSVRRHISMDRRKIRLLTTLPE